MRGTLVEVLTGGNFDYFLRLLEFEQIIVLTNIIGVLRYIELVKIRDSTCPELYQYILRGP